MPTSRGPNDEVELGRARERRWWVRGRRVRSIARAGLFVEDVGFALLFPSERVLVPSLWEAVAGEDVEPFATGMDVDEQRVWSWKDELPLRGLAWYGNFVAGRGSFLSPTLLQWLYPAYGETDDHKDMDLSATAHEIATALRRRTAAECDASRLDRRPQPLPACSTGAATPPVGHHRRRSRTGLRVAVHGP